MIANKNTNLHKTFNAEAELYHRARPHYPEALFSALVRTCKLRVGAELLEIGPGTGQATEPLARRGYKITAVELGADLAKVARKALKNYKNAKVITGAFEDVRLPLESFDLAYAATSFHWIKPECKFKKPHQLLRPDGHLAIIRTNHVSDEKGDKYFFASQPMYRKCQYRPAGKHDDRFRLNRTVELKAEEIDSRLFKLIFFRAFPIMIRYSAKAYAQLENTYSPTLAMKPRERQEFLQKIQKLIEEKFNGSILKHFAMTLTIARKIDSAPYVSI